jgi:hypothetical protein
MALSVNTAQQASASGISPNTLYYVALYALVVLVRFFKLKKESTGPWVQRDFMRVFHVGLEMVYTASGLIVLLLEDLRAYAPFIIIGYLILVLVSSQIESISEKFSEMTVALTHVVVIGTVAGLTIWYFEFAQKQLHAPPLLSGSTSIAEADFRVAIPYVDLALRQHLGSSSNGLTLVFLCTVKAREEGEAKTLALVRLRKEVKPFSPRGKPASSDALLVQDDQAFIRRLVDPAKMALASATQ